MRSTTRTVASLIVGLLLLTACEGGTAEDEASDAVGDANGAAAEDGAEGTDEPEAAGGTLQVAVPDLGTEDWIPQHQAGSQRTVYDLVNEALIGLDEDRNMVPRLAESWEVSEDGMDWHFTLREGVQFHEDWGELTAEDVKFSWGLYTAEDSLFSRNDVWRSAVSGDVEEGFEVVNDYEFILHGDGPNALLPRTLSYHNETIQIHSKEYWESEGQDVARTRPIGTGPFMFESQTPGVDVTLTAVDDHWRHTPEFETMVLKIVEDEAARLAQIRTGEVDIAQVSPAVAMEAESVGVAYEASEGAYQCNVHLGGIYPYEELEEGYSGIHKPDLPWVQDDDPEAGRAIREALSVAINREAIADELLSGLARPARAPMQLAFITDDTHELTEFDPDRASELLAEGGYPDGFTIDMPIFEQAGREAGIEIANAVAGMWEQIGITVNRIPMEYEPTFRAYMEDRSLGEPIDSGVAMVFQFCQNFDDTPAAQLQGSIMPGGAFTQFHHDASQELIPQILETFDAEEQVELTAELGRRLAEDYVSYGIVAVSAPALISEKVAEWPVLPGRGEYSNLEYVQLN